MVEVCVAELKVLFQTTGEVAYDAQVDSGGRSGPRLVGFQKQKPTSGWIETVLFYVFCIVVALVTHVSDAVRPSGKGSWGDTVLEKLFPVSYSHR